MKSAMDIIVPGYGRQQIVFVEPGHKAKSNAFSIHPHYWHFYWLGGDFYLFIHFRISALTELILSCHDDVRRDPIQAPFDFR